MQQELCLTGSIVDQNTSTNKATTTTNEKVGMGYWQWEPSWHCPHSTTMLKHSAAPLILIQTLLVLTTNALGASHTSDLIYLVN